MAGCAEGGTPPLPGWKLTNTDAASHFAPLCAQAHSEFRQAEALLEECEREIVKDGLVGVGAGAAIIGAIAAVAAVALSKR